MRSAKHGSDTLGVELSNVSAHGLWVLVDQKEYHLPFEHFPWFRDATIRQLSRIERPSPQHLYWPELDVDLTLDGIENPEKYPRVSKARRVMDRADERGRE